MSVRTFLILCAVALSGLGLYKFVSSLPERVAVGEARHVQRYEGEDSCHHSGYCHTCFPGFDGKNSCGFKFSAMCPGSRRAVFDRWEQDWRWENEERTRTRVYSTFVEALEGCH